MSERDKSELEQGLQSLGRAATGLAGRLLGPKAIGREELPPEAAISPEVDEAITRAGAQVGRVLHATGEALKAHPFDPPEALRTARASAADPVEADPGWTPLATGLMSLAGGLAKVAEGVLDVVAPRKPKGHPDDDAAEAESPIDDASEPGGTREA